MTVLTINLTGEKSTIELGAKIAELLAPSDVLALCGPLGAGKTRFVKGVAEGLGIDPDQVVSPTFKIIDEHFGRLNLYHMDFYRLQNAEEAEEIGIEDYFESDGVCAVEWADRLKSMLPRSAVRIHFEISGDDDRRLVIQVGKGRADAFASSLAAFDARIDETDAAP